jgi:hypothetical protein
LNSSSGQFRRPKLKISKEGSQTKTCERFPFTFNAARNDCGVLQKKKTGMRKSAPR